MENFNLQHCTIKRIFLTLILAMCSMGVFAQLPTLGTYPATTVISGQSTSVTPSAAPVNTARAVAATIANFTGLLSVNPVTGVVTVTNAQHAGVYTVTVTAFNAAGSTTTATFTLTVTNPNCSLGNFSSAADAGTGATPVSTTVGDFNEDGVQDFVVVNQGSDNFSILLGNGSGGFPLLSTVAVGDSPMSVSIGDFNGDGHQDLAIPIRTEDNVYIRLGDGLGGFSATASVAVGDAPNSVAIGDFNGDGHQDLAVPNVYDNNVSIRLGDGLGGFGGNTAVAVGALPSFAAIGDFNGDGKQDLAVVNSVSNNVSILLGNGAGGFTNTGAVASGDQLFELVIGDFNEDGIQDLAVPNLGSDNVAIRLGDGLGGFGGTTMVTVGDRPYSADVGDFNGDGHLDLAVANSGSDNVSVILGDGLGGFGGATFVAVGDLPYYVAVGDFNGDGRQDLISTNLASNNLSIRLGIAAEINVQGNAINISDGDSTPAAADHTDFGALTLGNNRVRTFTIQNAATATEPLHISSINSDNARFTVSGITLPATVAVNSSVTFTLAFQPLTGGTENATISIHNDDCDETVYDFAVTGLGAPLPTLGSYANITVITGQNTTLTPFSAPASTVSAVATTSTLFTGELTVNPVTGVVNITNAKQPAVYNVLVTAFNAAGSTTTATFVMRVNDPACSQGNFSSSTNILIGEGPNSLAVADFNGDGKQDFAVSNLFDDNVSIRLGNGNGTFGGTTSVTVGASPRSVAVADFNGDGKQDFAAANNDNTVSIRLGNGDGTFSGSTHVAVGSNPRSVAAGDFNGDGKQDFVVVNFGSNNVSIRLGNGDGTFSSSANVMVGTGPIFVAAGEFNGDGKQDFVVADGASNISVRFGNGDGTFSSGTNLAVGNTPVSIAVCDFNGDVIQDLAVANYNSNTVSIRLGNGDGSFSGSTNVAVEANPQSVAVGDFNADGNLDFVAANVNANTVSVRLGNGNGSFNGSTNVAMGNGPFSVAVGDFNGDGRQDFASANFDDATVSVRLGVVNKINVQGNATTIMDGDNTPAISDHTDFGITLPSSPIVRTFTVQNTGTEPLTISSITSGDNVNFMVGTLAPAGPIPANGSATFTVTFNAAALNTYNTTLTINSNDCETAMYNFAIKAEVNCSNPTITCPTDQSANTAVGRCTAVVSYPAPTVTGAPTPTLSYVFSGVTTGSGNGSGSGSTFNRGTTTVVLTATNSCTSTTCSFFVVVSDHQKPTITCPANTTVAASSTCTGSVGTYVLASKSDNCTSSGSITESQSNSGDGLLSGHNDAETVTLTANDGNGNTETCQFTVTLKDVTKPTITCPANTTIAASSTCTGSVGAYVLASKSDNCTSSGSITESQSNSGDGLLSGHNDAETVTLTANDGNGNTETCQFTVTLKDVTKPTITCPANTTIAASSTCTGSVGAYVLASKSDNCTSSGSITESQSNSGDGLLSGHNDAETVTLTANDGNGNTETCQFTVTLKDVTKPTITCPANTTIAASSTCTGSVGTYVLTSKSDNCTSSGSITESQSNSGDGLLSGHNDAETVTLTANDGNGNTETCQFTVTLKDVTKPTITCPANTTIAASSTCTGSVGAYVLASKSDNCTSSGSITESQSNSGDGLLSGHNDAETVTLTANDGNGNTETCQFTVTLKDVSPPSIVCPLDRTVSADADLCSSVQTYTVIASDNCTYTLTRTNGFASGTAFPLGYNVVNWQVTDAGGFSTICSFSITVLDNQPPTITCPNSSTTTTTPGFCTAVVNYSVSGSDNCSGWSLSRTSGLQSGAQFPVGTTTVGWRNTDTGGNSISCSFSVTVTDGQLPGITCPANITASAATGLCSATVNYTTPTVSDNCSGASAMHVSGGTSGSFFNKGVSTIEWKATDGANNTRTCSFTITVNDTQAPTITCPVNITANTGANTCAATVNFNNATATDNCTPAPTVAQTGGQASGSSFPKGMHTITFRATDEVGLTKTCSLRITVVDNVLPTITCPSHIVKNTDNNLCTAVATYTVTGADNCTSVSVSRASGLASGAAFPRGSSTVIWRATDLAGNSTLCSFTVTVNDTQQPGITCPASISTNMTTGQCSKVVNYTTPTYTDNCAGGSISLFSGLASGSVFPTGVSTVIWRAFDNSANSADCAFTVTVTDNELPVITCPPAATVAGSGCPCGYPASQLNTATATDNCAVTSLASDAPASLPAGATTIIWTAGDAAGNQKTCAYTVTVNCGASAGAKDEVGGMKDKERYEVRGMKDDAERESTHNSSLITHHLSLSPNPASDIVVVTLSNQQDLSRRGINSGSNQQINSSSNQQPSGSNQQLTIYDAQGCLVWEHQVPAGEQNLSLDLTNWISGIYYVVLKHNDVVMTKRLVIADH